MLTSGRQRILLLEDEPLIGMELSALVEEQGYQAVGPASTCDRALALLKTSQVHAALLDAIVGSERCDVVADALNERGVPWALVTGYDSEELRDRFHGIPLLTKPFAEDAIKDMLRVLLQK